MAAEQHKCPQCEYTAKTKGAITQHINKQHADDPTAKLAADFGVHAPRPGGAWKKDNPLQASPSGVPAIDYAIGIGGIPKGTVVEIFGDPAAGKTFVAMTFSAHAQQRGGRAGYVDAENALQPTFLQLIPGLDIDALEYSAPNWGEACLNVTKRYVATGLYDVWTVDSVHALVPEALKDVDIGDPKARAALARLMSESVPVLEHIMSETKGVLIFINHKKQKPDVGFGRGWYVPGGSALEYYSSVRLHVWKGKPYYGKDLNGVERQLGHCVKVKVEKSKVAAPFSTAEFDLFYIAGEVKADKDRNEPARTVVPGISLPSQWFAILREEGRIKASGGRYVDADSGEVLGNRIEVMEQLADEDSNLVKLAKSIVYPAEFNAPVAVVAQ